MTRQPPTIVLGSRSPRRRELLSLLVPEDRIAVLPPHDADEPGFEDLHNWPAIEGHLLEIARAKAEDVRAQVEAKLEERPELRDAAVLTADTTIVGTGSYGRLVVLEQPPEDDSYEQVVRDWFRRYFLGKTHVAATAVCVAVPNRPHAERVVRSEVTFRADGERWLDWYVRTGEPRGKAGGYAIQGAGSLFVSRIEGSPSNVVGLPLNETWELLAEAGALPEDEGARGNAQ